MGLNGTKYDSVSFDAGSRFTENQKCKVAAGFMQTRLLLASTTLVILTGLGNSLGISKTVNNPTNSLWAHESPNASSPDGMMSGEGSHDHKTLEIPTGQPVPSVSLIVHPDAMLGWNLEVKVSNFKFAPEKVNQESKATEGHAHLYINGKKMTRLYGSWYYLSSLEPGSNKITVTLNSNGHEDLVDRGKPIEATKIIQVNATKN